MKKTLFQKLLSVFSRTTYTISTKSFGEQFEGVTTASFKEVKVLNPANRYSTINYRANQIKKIIVVDENTHRVTLDNSPRLETRITLKNGKRTIFYFDTLALENGFLIGKKSRFLPINGQVIFEDIQKIEIQNGGKNFIYQ